MANEDSAVAKNQSSKPPPAEDRQCTNNRRSDLQNKNIGTSTRRLNREGVGTRNQDSEDVRALMVLVEEAGIDPNKTIRKTTSELTSYLGAAAAAEAVENNISAAVEQRDAGNIHTSIEAVLVAGLKKSLKGQGFTANKAKKEARGK